MYFVLSLSRFPFVDKISMMYDSTLLELKNILRDATNHKGCAVANNAFSNDNNYDNNIQLQNNKPVATTNELNSAQCLINIIRLDKQADNVDAGPFTTTTSHAEHSNKLFQIICQENRIK